MPQQNSPHFKLWLTVWTGKVITNSVHSFFVVFQRGTWVFSPRLKWGFFSFVRCKVLQSCCILVLWFFFTQQPQAQSTSRARHVFCIVSFFFIRFCWVCVRRRKAGVVVVVEDWWSNAQGMRGFLEAGKTVFSVTFLLHNCYYYILCCMAGGPASETNRTRSKERGKIVKYRRRSKI